MNRKIHAQTIELWMLIRNPSCGEFDVKQICARGQSCSSAWPTLLRHSLESGFLSTRFAIQLTRLIPSPIDSYRWGTCEKIYCAEHISYKVYEHGEGGSQLPLERAEKDLVQYKLVARICTNAETVNHLAGVCVVTAGYSSTRCVYQWFKYRDLQS